MVSQDGRRLEWRPEIMYGKEPLVNIPHATATSEVVGKTFAAEEAGSIFPESHTPGALSLLQGTGQVPPHRQMELTFGRREGHSKWIIVKGPLLWEGKYVLLRQVRREKLGWVASMFSPRGSYF